MYACKIGVCAKYIFAGGTRLAQNIRRKRLLLPPGPSWQYKRGHGTRLGSKQEEINVLSLSAQPERIPAATGGQTWLTNILSQEFDDETGLYFYNARYYNPVLGRFISADSIIQNYADPQTLNRYSYVRNNPIIYNDPTGHAYDWVVGAAVGAVVGGYQAERQGGHFWRGAVVGAAAGAAGGWAGGYTSSLFTTTSLFSSIVGGIVGGTVGGAVGGGMNASMNGGHMWSGAAEGAKSGAAGGAVGGAVGIAVSSIFGSGYISAAAGGYAGAYAAGYVACGSSCAEKSAWYGLVAAVMAQSLRARAEAADKPTESTPSKQSTESLKVAELFIGPGCTPTPRIPIQEWWQWSEYNLRPELYPASPKPVPFWKSIIDWFNKPEYRPEPPHPGMKSIARILL